MSAWLREAGREKAEARRAERRIRSRQALREFFAECDEREQGLEPDWEEHRKVIERSKRSGTGED